MPQRKAAVSGERFRFTCQMLERALRATFRSFSTLFVVAAAITIPVHLVHAFVFRDVISVLRLTPEIEALPRGLEIKDVSPADLDGFRASLAVLAVAELALLPLAARAARRVVEVSDSGGVPTAPDAWRHALKARQPLGKPPLAPVAAGAAITAAVFVLARGLGAELAGMIPDERVWPVLGLLEGLTRAISAPFVAVPLAFSGGWAKDSKAGRPTS